MEFLQLRSVIATTKAEHEIGYRPLFTFEEGLEPTIAYLRRNYEQRAASVREI
jgi:nucleoside-diphosphate-sugar epimerase